MDCAHIEEALHKHNKASPGLFTYQEIDQLEDLVPHGEELTDKN